MPPVPQRHCQIVKLHLRDLKRSPRPSWSSFGGLERCDLPSETLSRSIVMHIDNFFFPRCLAVDGPVRHLRRSSDIASCRTRRVAAWAYKVLCLDLHTSRYSRVATMAPPRAHTCVTDLNEPGEVTVPTLTYRRIRHFIEG